MFSDAVGKSCCKGENMAKPIEELTITDDFMFGAVMRNPKLCRA